MPYDLPPTRPVYNEPWETCPITGFSFPRSKGVWVNGRLVHPLAADRPDPNDPAPSPAGPEPDPLDVPTDLTEPLIP